jgi:hypothetical protein
MCQLRNGNGNGEWCKLHGAGNTDAVRHCWLDQCLNFDLFDFCDEDDKKREIMING